MRLARETPDSTEEEEKKWSASPPRYHKAREEKRSVHNEAAKQATDQHVFSSTFASGKSTLLLRSRCQEDIDLCGNKSAGATTLDWTYGRWTKFCK